jgi:hypothetical protein
LRATPSNRRARPRAARETRPKPRGAAGVRPRTSRAVAFGAGLGWIYVAAGRNAAASIGARVAFSLAAVVLEGLQIIG